MRLPAIFRLAAILALASFVHAQTAVAPTPLDPTRDIARPVLERSMHTPLPEEYIWTARSTAADDRVSYRRPRLTERTERHFFRAEFPVATVPSAATLYVAGPRSLRVWLNGQLAERAESDLNLPLGMHVFAAPVAGLLRQGQNTIAIEAVRGRGVSGFANSAMVRQQTFGEVLVVKIVPAARGVLPAIAPPLVISNGAWKSAVSAPQGWQLASFNDRSWPQVQTIGGIESSIELFQWNADAGLYDWPGYDGISGFLAHTPILPSAVLSTFAGRGEIVNSKAVTEGKELDITLPAHALSDSESPSLLLDFGRELTGRVELISASDTPLIVTLQMGESEPETLKAPYLGINQLVIPPHGTAHGPKSAFRYARIVFRGEESAGGPQTARFSAIRVDHIFYPVTYAGSFTSSDAQLNRIWETGAYTAHLCMQDGVWDASKRDRGRWMGDTDVSGRVIEDVFADRPLMEDTLDRLIGPAPPGHPIDQHVNGIPGYSSFWFTGLADYYRHTGAKDFLLREHERMVQLLSYVDKEFDERGVYANKSNVWLYVDWSPELNGDTAETRRATTLEFLRAYREAAWLLREMGDTANADKYDRRANEVQTAAAQFLLDPATGAFGPRWQTNAAAVISGAPTPAQYDAIWRTVLSNVGHVKYNAYIISPYYNYYVLRAMAMTGHRAEALAWIRQYWGGMIEEGATSFWEAYDPSWYKDDFHASLQSDNRSGYFVSLAHGWSSGPTAWLMEEVLGIHPTGAGFSTVDIRPELLDLQYATGAEPTPHGLLQVDIRKLGTGTQITVDVPEAVVARVLVPVATVKSTVTINGKIKSTESSGPGEPGRRAFMLDHSGHYVLTSR